MKTHLLVLMVLFGASGSYAGEKILLDREEITAQSSNLILIRTEKSPQKVRITMPVRGRFSECVDGWETRHIPGTFGPQCGMPYYTYYPSRRGAVFYGYACGQVVEFCRGYSRVEDTIWKKVVLKFKKGAEVFGGEEEYALDGYQSKTNEYDFDFTLRSLSFGARHEIRSKSGDVLTFQILRPRFVVE
jgi:hypothetical protein